MKQSYKNNDLLNPYLTDDIRQLYKQYADKLLGYILPLVNNRQLAEDCVVKVFAKISSSRRTLQPTTYSSTWVRFMALANTEIECLGEIATTCKSVVDNNTYVGSHKYLNRMSEVQRKVFCGIYYHRKTTAALAHELQLKEQELRLALKEAFMIIRKVKDEN